MPSPSPRRNRESGELFPDTAPLVQGQVKSAGRSSSARTAIAHAIAAGQTQSVAQTVALTRATPFVKWAGGKGRLLPQLQPLLPKLAAAQRYHEPFVGGGAMFFALGHARSALSDLNPELVVTYEMIRDDVDGLIAELGEHFYDKDHYYAVRAQQPKDLTDVERAARFIFLNRTCFNGLHRVNQRGQFNVPFGKYANPTICDEDGLRRASAALQGVELRCEGYEGVVGRSRPGDFVYFDPPYEPLTKTASFTAYTAAGFGGDAQGDLVAVMDALDAKGVRVMLSNSDTPAMRKRYKGYDLTTVQAPRAISRDGASRLAVSELVVRNY